MVKAIIFDFDGVIHDTFEIGFRINKSFNPDISVEKYKDFFNGNLYGNRKEVNPVSIQKFHELQDKEFELLVIEEEIKKELLKLKQKYKLFIVTSNKESTLKRYFEKNKLGDLFNEILGIETDTSKITKFGILLNKYKMEKEDCFFVTDTLGDILEANKVGLKSIAVNYGFHETERLRKGNPFKIISHVSEIERLLR